jgi:DNA topoisomerase-1
MGQRGPRRSRSRQSSPWSHPWCAIRRAVGPPGVGWYFRELMRFRRSNPSRPGYRRQRAAAAFTYLDLDRPVLTDTDALARIERLVIPPAWERVWICPDPLGHLQARGVDCAGRTQYLYHERWREQQDHDRVLACAVCLLHVGLFRVGSEVYEHEDHHLGLATLAKDNVTS